ncbi:hypothetical protein [Clostridium sp.]|uniref:hypothetical protein n=1 Tax=Clostridium sp. TaxID=1506 RepID=UPI0025BE68A3|nr:hypothetical protein [Clostridium sp.]
MINNSNDFAITYSDLLSKHNYKGLVGLLSSTEFKDDSARKTAEDLKRRFQEQADIEDKLLEGADDNTKRAYYFVTSGPSKNDISTDESNPLYNSFSSKFMRGWNSLVDENNNINVQFNNEDEYNKFISSLGGDENNIRKKGISINSNYSISFACDIDDKIGIYNALKDSGVYDYKDNTTSNQYYKGLDYNGVPISPGSSEIITDKYGNTYAAGESGSIAYEKYGKINKFNEMTAAVNEASEAYAKLFEMKDIKPYINEMIVSGYMGEDDRQLQQSFSAGLMDLATFKEMRSILEEKYNRVLNTKSLSQFDVWSMNEDNEGSQVLEKLDDPIMKDNLDIEINQAIADGRLHYSHATNGMDIGTMIVIDPAVKDGKIVEGSKPRRLFVKDLFKSQAENALRNDTQTAAQMAYAKHQTYGHVYRTSDGGIINGWTGQSDSAIYKNKNGVEQVVGKADVLDIIDNDIIAKRMIDYYDLATQVDKDGKGYTQEYFKVFGNGGFNATNFYNNIAAKCTAAMANKYKGQSEDFIKYKANELISIILRNLHNVHKQESKDTFSELYMENSGNNLY